MRLAFRLAILGLGCSLYVPTLAQQPAPTDPLAALQAKAALTDEDLKALRGALQPRIDALANGAAGSARELRAMNTGSQSFKEAYAKALIEMIGGALPKAKAAGAAQLISLLNGVKTLEGVPLLTGAAKHPEPAVRTAAIVALRNLQPEIALAGGGAFNEVLAALRDQGKVEQAAIVLKLIYAAMDYPSAVARTPDARVNAAAVLDVLEARAAQYSVKDALPKAESADSHGLKLARTLAKEFNDVEKARLVESAAAILRYAVIRYAGELHRIGDGSSADQVDLRNRSELMITEGEELLKALLAPKEEQRGHITEVMQTVQKDSNPVELKVEMNKWAELLKGITGKDFSTDASE